ncbi:MAG: endopeptidase La, partial [Archangium sp.]|nr:endopeptidase La [Archangium sp.]
MPSFRKPLPLVPLRDIIVMPHEVRPLFVGRDRSIAALRDAVAHPSTDGKSYVVFGLQKNAKTNEPTADDLLTIGTLTQIIQLLPLPDGTVKVLIEGISRVRVTGFAPNEAHFMAEYDIVDESVEAGVELEALMRAVLTTLKAYTEVNKRIPLELYQQIALIEDPARMSDTIVEKLPMKPPDKQRFLELESPIARLEKLHEFMQREVEIQKVDKKIRTRVKKQMERTQKEFYLNEQMQAIQQELGQKDDGGKSELQELEDKLKAKKLPDEALTRMKKELKKLKLMGPMSAEATVVRNYIDWVLSLPWGELSKDRLDVLEAEKVLDADHYGLEKVKERLIDYLAVQQLAGSVKGPILCFVGPPGVGKTSLGRSIARALERKFVRISLGGVRDEAEIRGHRRTYIGAMPGKIVQSLKKAETSNPVFLLDEIDKMSSDFRGDPSAALLEVLDPEQNATFADHYLDLDFDLSKVMFICTANSMHTIPQPLQDRMEIIRIAGYTEAEKLAIARKYLIPKQKEANGLADTEVAFTTKAIRTVIRRYTRESGVRNLERELAGVFRKCARRVIADGKKPLRVDSKTVIKMLGATKVPKDVNEISDQVGMVNGLAWTEHGGEVL